MLQRLLLPAFVALAVLAPPAAAQIRDKTFDPASFVGFVSDDVVFLSNSREIEIVPLADLVVRGAQLALAGGLAETTSFIQWLPMPVTLYTRSGSAEHAKKALLYATILMIIAVDPAAKLEAHWTGKSGIKYDVVVSMQPKETMQEFYDRFAKLVDELKKRDPPQNGK